MSKNRMGIVRIAVSHVLPLERKETTNTLNFLEGGLLTRMPCWFAIPVTKE